MLVIFPSGKRIYFRHAKYLSKGPDYWQLLTSRDGGWVADIQMTAGVIVIPYRKKWWEIVRTVC